MENSINPANQNKARRISLILHLLLILISWIVTFEKDPDKTIDTQYAVTVSFQEIEFTSSKSSNSTKSSASEGRQRPKEPEVRKIEKPKPIEVKVPKPTVKPTPTPKPTEAPKPEPTDPVFSETTTEISEIEAVEEEIIVDEPEPEYIPESIPDPEPVEEEVLVTNPDLPSIEDVLNEIEITDDPEETTEVEIPEAEETGSGETESTTDGSGDNDPSLKDGDEGGTGRGDTGSGKGNDEAGDDNDSGIGSGGAGEGEFDASGDGIFGRKVIYRDPSILQVSGRSGKIVFKVCVNRRGLVSTVQIDELETTVRDYDLLRKALESMRKYKYEPDLTAPKEQCGQYTVKIDNYQGIR